VRVVCRHEGPVWQLAWAHPVYGSVLATCGYDRKVILWKEQDSGWAKIYEYSNHDSSGKHIGKDSSLASSHTVFCFAELCMNRAVNNLAAAVSEGFSRLVPLQRLFSCLAVWQIVAHLLPQDVKIS